jgi:hypothetical protein
MTATARPSDSAIARAFWKAVEDRPIANAVLERIVRLARTLDAAPADPVVSGECWRRAVLEGCAIKSFLPSAEWFEQRAIELAREGK